MRQKLLHGLAILTILTIILPSISLAKSLKFLRNEAIREKEVLGKDARYTSFISAEDQLAVHLNREIMARYRPEMKKYYFDPSKYKTYLEQLGIDYPTRR